jgi:hypothetical protein
MPQCCLTWLARTKKTVGFPAILRDTGPMTSASVVHTIDGEGAARRDRLKLRVILTHEADVAERAFRRQIDMLPVEIGSPAQFWSGARIVKGFDLIVGAVREFGIFALKQAEQLSAVSDRYDLVIEAIENLWVLLCEWVPVIIWPPDGAPIAGYDEVEAEARMLLARERGAIDSLIHFCEDGRQTDRRERSSAPDPAPDPEWGNLPERPLGPIPSWLNMYQAAGWVCFRTARAMVTLDRASLLHAEIRYSGIGQVQTPEDFEAALKTGKPVAQGARAEDGVYETIPAATWSTFTPVPLYSSDAAPYRDIRIQRYVLEAAFPAAAALVTRSRRSLPVASLTSVAEWLKSLPPHEAKQSQQHLCNAANATKNLTFSGYKVTNAQIRELTPHRKRGPKAKF